jgi:hypothetical protein
MLEANTTRFIFAIAAFVVGGGLMFGAQEVIPDVVEDARDKIVALVPGGEDDGIHLEDTDNNGEADIWENIVLGRDQSEWRIVAKKGKLALVFRVNRVDVADTPGGKQTTYWRDEQGNSRNFYFLKDDDHPYLGSNLQKFASTYYDENFTGHRDAKYVQKITVNDPVFSEWKKGLAITGNGTYDSFTYNDWQNQKKSITNYTSGSDKNAFIPSISDLYEWDVLMVQGGILTFKNKNETSTYWLRSNGGNQGSASYINDVGNLQPAGMGASYDLRPALVIDVSTIKPEEST